MKAFLESSQYINWDHPSIIEQADLLSQGCKTDEQLAKNCFEFVRDHICHTGDQGEGPVTCKASDVLHSKTGYCYAKSHLLAALLRANKIPAALCYQRLTIDSDKPPYCLHGLNAVYLNSYGWYRIDPRGNKPGVNAQFSPPAEQLAFPVGIAGERDIAQRFAMPLLEIVAALNPSYTVEDVANNLPDIDLGICEKSSFEESRF